MLWHSGIFKQSGHLSLHTNHVLIPVCIMVGWSPRNTHANRRQATSTTSHEHSPSAQHEGNASTWCMCAEWCVQRTQNLINRLPTFQQIDVAHALDTLPLLKLVPFGTLPPGAVRGTVPRHSQVGTQLHTLYVYSGRLSRLHSGCQRCSNTGDLLLLLLLS